RRELDLQSADLETLSVPMPASRRRTAAETPFPRDAGAAPATARCASWQQTRCLRGSRPTRCARASRRYPGALIAALGGMGKTEVADNDSGGAGVAAFAA